MTYQKPCIRLVGQSGLLIQTKGDGTGKTVTHVLDGGANDAKSSGAYEVDE